MLALSFLPLLLLATAGLAASSRRATSVPASVLAQLLPANQLQLVAPTDAPTFVALVTGFQNFTCNPQGEWAPDGFAGQLFDISSLFPGSEFSQIQNDAYTDWVSLPSPSTDPLDPTFAKQVEDKYGIPLSGQYFAPSGANGVTFDFRNNGPTAGNPDAFVDADVTGHIRTPAPTGDSDSDWQAMTGTSGKFASTIFRVSTHGGERFLTEGCEPFTPGDQAKFTAQLYFYGSKL
ncbi:hypothetical protein EDB85DRAFT_1924250 [Lactarius pseudohatsudake]|nr:hypothetical protein EDB85DRAFT_1924250 [Lactarius pseudohatsudake]